MPIAIVFVGPGGRQAQYVRGNRRNEGGQSGKGAMTRWRATNVSLEVGDFPKSCRVLMMESISPLPRPRPAAHLSRWSRSSVVQEVLYGTTSPDRLSRRRGQHARRQRRDPTGPEGS